PPPPPPPPPPRFFNDPATTIINPRGWWAAGYVFYIRHHPNMRLGWGIPDPKNLTAGGKRPQPPI
ncbi:hypothetical protein ACVGWC_10050, partial [Enterobacter hormaechei]